MICPFKIAKNPPAKTRAIEQASVSPGHPPKIEPLLWSPLTAGPYLVPVTRWVE